MNPPPSSSLLFLTSGFGDNLLGLPLAIELEEKTRLTIVTPAGPQTEFFARCLPQARAISYDKSWRSLIQILKTGWSCQVWIYPVGACTRKLRLLHLLAPFRPAFGFTSMNSHKAWQAEIGLKICIPPDFARRAWKNNLRLLPFLDLDLPRRLWLDYEEILRPRLKDSPRNGRRLIIHAGSARYSGNLERYKRWPLARFFKVAESLLQQKAFDTVDWVLGPDDVDLLPSLEELRRQSLWNSQMSLVSHTNFQGSLIKMGEYLSSAGYLLSNDSGLAHLASFYDVPMTVIMSGLGEPSYSGENNARCQLIIEPTECYGCAMGISAPQAEKFECPFEWACMDQITPERVLHSIRTHIKQIEQKVLG